MRGVMETIDQFVDFLIAAYGKQPDQLRSFEKQTIAVMAVAAASRFAPAMSQGAINNAVTRAPFLYVARHPLATVAAFWFAAYRNSQYRQQWAGEHTRLIETVGFVPIFERSSAIIRYGGRVGQAILRQSIAHQTSRLARFLSNIRVPAIPQWVVNNSVTRGAVRYAARHPAAALASYLTANYIDSTYRPQFFGRYSQEAITAGLFPLFAHSPGALPKLIRGAGSTAYYSSRGMASILEWFVNRPPPKVIASYNPAEMRALLEFLRGIAPERQVSAVSFSVLMESRRFQQIVQIANGLSNSRPTLAFVDALTEAELLLLQSEAWANSLTGRISYQVWRVISYPNQWVPRILDLKILPAFPKTSRWLIRASWRATAALKVLAPLTPWLGNAVYGRYVIQPLVWIAGTGFVAPIFLTGTLRGAGAEVGEWARTVYQVVRHPLRFLAHELGAISQTLRLPQIVSLARSIVPGAQSIGTATRGAGRLGGSLFRNVVRAGNVFQVADLLSGGTIFEGDNPGYIPFDPYQYARNEDDRRVAHANHQTLVIYSLKVQEFIRGERAQDPGEPEPAYPGGPGWDENYARRLSQMRSLFNASRAAAPVFNALLSAGEKFTDIVTSGLYRFTRDTVSQQQQANASARATAARDAWRNQPRDERGRFARPTFGFNTGQPLPGFGFDQALAYINRLAQAVAKTKTQQATIGVPVEPAIRNGSVGELFGGQPRRFWLYRGRDRDLLLQTLRDMLEILKRDELLASGKPSATLSNREPVFPDAVPGLAGSLIVLVRALKYDVSLVREPGTADGAAPLSNSDLYDYLYSMWPNLAPFGGTENEQ
jgi:hypothetical protein